MADARLIDHHRGFECHGDFGCSADAFLSEKSLVYSRWLFSPQLLKIGLCPLGWMGVPPDIEKLR